MASTALLCKTWMNLRKRWLSFCKATNCLPKPPPISGKKLTGRKFTTISSKCSSIAPEKSPESKPGRVIQKLPGQLEFFGQRGGQGFYAKCLRGVMTAVENVQPQFFRQGKCPMRAFTGDERVHAFARGLLQFTARTAGHDPDVFTNLFSAGKQFRFYSGRTFQFFGEF